ALAAHGGRPARFLRHRRGSCLGMGQHAMLHQAKSGWYPISVSGIEVGSLGRGVAVSLQIDELLRSMVQKGASDLHIKAGSAPGFRIDGGVVQQDEFGILPPEASSDLARQLMGPE